VAVTIEQRAPRARCYKCGAQAIAALCHHCWRPGCKEHVLPSPRWAEQLFGAEGSGPALGDVRARHCSDCAHIRAGHWLEFGMVGLGLALAGLIAMATSLIAGVLLIAAGGMSATWAYAHIRQRSAHARAGLPVPLHPKVSAVQLIERLPVHITLGSQGEYWVKVQPVQGKLTMTLRFGSHDRDRVSRPARKRTPNPGAGAPYSAGCLVLQGQVGINGLGEVPGLRVLTGDSGDIPALRAGDSPASSSRNVSYGYRLLSDPKISPGPFWIVPSIVPESGRRVLELDIQWTEFGPDGGTPLELDVIELLRIGVPVGWGNVHGVNHRATSVSPDAPGGGQGVRTLEWKQLSPDESEREERRLTIVIRFEHEIARDHDLSGRLEATMNGTLSGVSGIRMYNALGAPRPLPGKSVKTRVEADFTLSLESIRYQDIRVVPDRAEQDSDRDRYADEFDAIPDDETVIALTNALCERDYYVKRVVENPPRSGGRANVIHRFWDIAGRKYAGVYPIDFHLVLTGEEIHEGDVRPESGTTKIRIVVKGAYTDTDEDMYARVETEWRQLQAVTEDAIKRHVSMEGEPG
jgi:hypothetical protein